KFEKEGSLKEPLDEEQRNKALWNWVASKRVQDIKQSRELVGEIRTKLQNEWNKENFTIYGPTEPRGKAVRALRLEQLGDKSKARATWGSLAQDTEKHMDQHEWYLLASQRRQALPDVKDDQALAERVQLVAKILQQAKQAGSNWNDPVRLR